MCMWQSSKNRLFLNQIQCRLNEPSLTAEYIKDDDGS